VGATVVVVDGGGADGADIRNLGLDGVSGSLAVGDGGGPRDDAGRGGQRQRRPIIDLGAVTLAGGAGTVTLAGDLTGALASGGAIGKLNVGDDVTGSIAVEDVIGYAGRRRRPGRCGG
jgi:hypothetical protein